MDGNEIGGKNFEFGLKEGCVGIPENHKNMEETVYQKAMELSKLIEVGEITVPFDDQTYKIYEATFSK